MKFKINMQLLPMKAYYFLWYAGTASLIPFLGVYSKQLGCSGFIVGLLFTVPPIIGIILKPIIAGIADTYKIQKKVFLIVQGVCASGVLILILIPAFPTRHKIHFNCNEVGSSLNLQTTLICTDDIFGGQATEEIICKISCPFEHFRAHIAINGITNNSSYLYIPIKNFVVNGTEVDPFCIQGTNISTECDIDCNTVMLNEMISKPNVRNADFYKYYQFWLLLLIKLMCDCGSTFSINIADAICFQILGDNHHKYGHQKIFSAIGWFIFGVFGGYLVDTFSIGHFQKNHVPSFGLSCRLLLLSMVASYKVQYTQQTHRANLIRDISKTFFNIRIIIYFIWCTSWGVCCGITWGFVFWLLEDLATKQGCGVVRRIKTIEGLSLSIDSLLGEVPCYFCSAWIFRTLGHPNVMTLTLFLSALRFIIYSLISNPWWVLPIAVLTGAIKSLSHTAMVSYASIVAPRGAETSTQTLVGAAFQGGLSLGGFVGGVLITSFGSTVMFRLLGAAYLVLCGLHIIVQYFIRKFSQSTIKECHQMNLL